jgi:HAE1 family hydrophobic/amphiphilic exporter-1
MKTIPGLVDADSTLRSGKPEVRLDDRPPARRRPGRFRRISSWRSTPWWPDKWPRRSMRAKTSTTCECARQEQFRVSPEELARMTVPSNKGRGVGLDEVVHSCRARAHRPSTASTGSGR